MYGLLLWLTIRSLKKSLKSGIFPSTTCWSLIWKQTDLKDIFLKIYFNNTIQSNQKEDQYPKNRKRLRASSYEPGWPGWPAYRVKFRSGFIWENSARFPRWEKAEDPGDEFWNGMIRKTKQKMAKRNWVITFAPIMALPTLLAVSLQLTGLLIMWKIHQAKQNDAMLCDKTALLRHRPFNALNACAIAKNSSR